SVLKTKEADRGTQAIARRPRENEQLLAHLAREVRRRTLAHQRRHPHRVPTQQRLLDLFEVAKETPERIYSATIACGGLSHGRRSGRGSGCGAYLWPLTLHATVTSEQ